MQLRAELAGPNPSPLERLLVERIAICWLQSYHADQRHASATSWTTSLNYAQEAERAQRRLESAIRTLATVRRLALGPSGERGGAADRGRRPRAPARHRTRAALR
jgi:hypothetical protein